MRNQRLIFLFLWLWFQPLAAKAAVFAVDCPLPQVRHLVIQWLKTQRFSSVVEERKGYGFVYRIKADRAYRITISPDSPLQTKVSADLPTRYLRDLRDFLHFYLEEGDSGGLSPPGAMPGGRAFRSLVCITAFDGGVVLSLSGILLSPEVVLTSAHTLALGMPVEITFYDGSRGRGEIVFLDQQVDLALIRLERPHTIRHRLRPLTRPLKKGERVEALACPFREANPRRKGVLEGPRMVNGYVLWQAHLVVEPGWSGGPVLNEAGELVGIIKGRLKGDKRASFIVPWPLIQKFLSWGEHASEIRALRSR